MYVVYMEFPWCSHALQLSTFQDHGTNNYVPSCYFCIYFFALWFISSKGWAVLKFHVMIYHGNNIAIFIQLIIQVGSCYVKDFDCSITVYTSFLISNTWSCLMVSYDAILVIIVKHSFHWQLLNNNNISILSFY